LSASQLALALAAASNMSAAEQTRVSGQGVAAAQLTTARPSKTTDPGNAAMMDIWRMLPGLDGVPDDLLAVLNPNYIFQLNMALAQNQKYAAKLSVNARLAANAKKLALSPTYVAAGQDNRRDILHDGRFLPGACCPNTELWLRGKQVIGERGATAIGSYDLDSVGCGGCVTPKGWELLHNPASPDLKIKMFYLPNVSSCGLSTRKVSLEDGNEGLTVGDSLKEVSDLDGYRTALNSLREALHSVLPWNRSVSAIVGFMVNTGYLQEELRGNPRRGNILAEFTDYILGRNALNYGNDKPFMTTDDISHAWYQWKGKRSTLISCKKEEKPNSKQSATKKNDICKRFNVGVCPKQSDKECKSFFGHTLRHVCNKFVGPNKHCEKDHPRTQHK